MNEIPFKINNLYLYLSNKLNNESYISDKVIIIKSDKEIVL